MRQQVQTFRVGRDNKPVAAGTFDVEGRTVDDRLAAARRRLTDAGNKVRSVNAGKKRIVAYVEAR